MVEWLIFLSGFLVLLIGFVVWLNDTRGKINFWFGIFSIVAFAQIFFDFLFRFFPNLLVLRSAYAFAALIPTVAVFWILEICNVKIRTIYKLFIVVPGIIFFIISYINGLVVRTIKDLSVLGYRGILGPLFPLYTLCITSYVLLFLILLYYSQKNSDTLKRIQLRYILFGILSYSILAIFFSLILPVFLGIYNFTLLDAPSLIFFVGFTAYAITKHHLFNIRVIATELFTFVIWATLLIRIFASVNIQDVIVNIIIFGAMILFGILLIRSVIKEVRQREEIAQMAEDVKRAYVVEKRAKEELEQLDKFKDQFLLTAQHNLRTPLTSIMGYSDLLLNGTFGKQNKKTLEVIGKLQILTQGMIKMVNNFLDMAQFQLGKSVINLKPGVKVASLVNEVIGELKFKAESKGIFLNFDASEQLPVINADSEKLKAALFNIIDNAVKYTTKGGVSVKVSDQNTNDQNLKPNTLNRKSILIVIRDTGIGIPEEKLSVMFESQFERSEAAKKITSMGSGVGLYLAGQIIKAHNGRVWAESEGEGKGSAFFVELPTG